MYESNFIVSKFNDDKNRTDVWDFYFSHTVLRHDKCYNFNFQTPTSSTLYNYVIEVNDDDIDIQGNMLDDYIETADCQELSNLSFSGVRKLSWVISNNFELNLKK